MTSMKNPEANQVSVKAIQRAPIPAVSDERDFDKM